MRKVIFKLNKNLDKEMINVFLNHKQGGIDFSGCVLGVHPELKKVLNMTDKKRKKKIDEFVNVFYKNNKKFLEKQVKKFNLKWTDIEGRYFNLIKNIFRLKKIQDYQYIGYVSIINCCPRFLKDKSFQVFFYNPDDFIYVAMHEILHFFFYDYVFKNYPKFKKLDPNRGILWELAEIFNSVILAEPEFKKIHKQKRDWSYPAHQKYLERFKEYWHRDKDIDELTKKGFDYLKKTTG